MTETAIAPVEEKRQVALLKAVGLDRLAPEQRELALNLARRYELDLLLKHLVLIEGRAYVTRDGLLHIAHRSGVFDGMEASEPVLDGEFWRATCSVYRRDMSRPFTYPGRYPAKGGNQKYAPEMATKVAEVAALRRAFDVSAPTAEERWDEANVDVPSDVRRPTLDDRIAERHAAIAEPEPAVIERLERYAGPPPEHDDEEPLADTEEVVVPGGPPPLSRGAFNRLALGAHVTKADVAAGKARLGISGDDITDEDYGRLAIHLGLSL
jgi:hypothetical protein